MNIYEREAALYNIQEVIVKTIKSNNIVDIETLKQKMQPLYNQREQIMNGNEEIINKYKIHKENIYEY